MFGSKLPENLFEFQITKIAPEEMQTRKNETNRTDGKYSKFQCGFGLFQNKLF